MSDSVMPLDRHAGAAPAPAPSRAPTVALLAVILAVAAVLRVREALRTPMWFDEIFTVWIARLSPHDVLGALAHDVHPPLHFLMVWGWRALGGEGDLWLKSLSMLIGLTTLAVTWAMARDLFGRGAGWIAAALLAVQPDHVYFSQEVRNYVLLHLLVAVSGWRAWRWTVSGGRRDAALYALAATAALYTHYLAGVALGFLGLWGLVATWREPRRRLGWIGIHVVIAALFAPQLPTFLAQITINREHWIRPSTLEQLLGVARKLSFRALYLIPPMFGLALWPLWRARDRRAASMLWTMAFLPVLLTWTLTRMGAHLFIERYMFFTLPAFCALIAAGIAGIGGAWLRRGTTVILVAFGLRSVLISPAHLEAASLGRAAAWLAPRIEPGDLVLCADTHTFMFVRQHLAGRGRQRLLLMDPHLPYYEGALLIPDSLRVYPPDLAAARDAQVRWWGVRTRVGGIPTAQAAALLAAASTAPPRTFDLVTVWAGGK